MAQSAVGINENVHTLARWHRVFTAAGLSLEAFSLTDSFNAINRKLEPPARASERHPLDVFYHSRLEVTPQAPTVRVGEPVALNVRVSGRGPASWRERGPIQIRLSHHIACITREGSQMVAFENDRVVLDTFVGRDRPRTFSVVVSLEEPGIYEISFDLVHEMVTWFSGRGGTPAVARVSVV